MKCDSKRWTEKGKKNTCFVLLLLFISISLFLMCSTTQETTSSLRSQMLKKVITRKDNMERLDYVDENGMIRIADDAGFATSISTYNESSKLEEYFDENGQPIARYNRYYAILREYNEKNQNYRITYLGQDGKPTATYYGYSVLVRTFNDNGDISTEKYFDSNGNAVNTNTYGCGFSNEYDELGNIVMVTYLDKDDNPIMTGQGYAIVTRTYYDIDSADAGKVENEFYYDAEFNPIALSLGQYGVRKAEYDAFGNNAWTTYLDADGNEIITDRGYTSVLRTYKANNTIESERYYDIKGNPYKLPDGQYGVKYINDQAVYLNKNGRVQFNLRRLFYNHKYLVALFATIAVIVSVCSNRKINFVYLIGYLCALAYFTLMFRETSDTHVNLNLFWSYKAAFTDKESWSDILRNIWLFIPLGAILFKLIPRKTILIVPILLSTIIELIQYATGTGFCELDDILNNSIGGLIGYEAGILLTPMTPRFKEKLKSWREKKWSAGKNTIRQSSLLRVVRRLPDDLNRRHSRGLKRTPLDGEDMAPVTSVSSSGLNTASTSTWTTICKAISASLLNKNITIEESEDWQEVFTESKKQAVASIVRNGVKNYLPQSLATEWRLYSIQEIGFAVQLLEAQRELTTLLDSYNIHHVILKGSAAAVYYPEPYLRFMGDVDFWVTEESFSSALGILKKADFEELEGSDERHLKLRKDNILFEMHRHFSIDAVDSNIDDYIENAEFVKGRIRDSEFWMLPELENGLVLLVHLRQHLYEGLGLRQVLDWMMYCHSSLDEDCWKNFRIEARTMGLERLALVVTRLCVKYFGLKASWCGTDDGTAGMLMNNLIQSGNFGKNNSRGLPVEKTMINFHKEGLWYLQKAGEFNWRKTLDKHPCLRPFAWFYQICRYIRQVGTSGRIGRSLKDDIKRSNERYELLKALELL